MSISIDTFSGEIPRTHPRLLPAGFAQIAVNARLENGALEPIRRGRQVHTFGEAMQTIYLHNGDWLGFPGIVDIHPGPVAADRLYYTGDGPPKVRAGVEVFNLALPAPATKPTIAVTGTVDPDLLDSIVYAYTFVTELDEESPPSPVSDAADWSPTLVVTIDDFAVAPAARGIDRLRIYRSQTSSSGITDLYLVKELPVATLTYDHDLEADPLMEVIPSTFYDPPPDTMQGLTAMPNGMMAAFDGKTIHFSEPFVPHAWPSRYSLVVPFNIVGLSSFGTTLAIMTEGTPYIVQGTGPDTMSMEQMETGKPCVARRGIVDLGYAAAYPSFEGLVLITPSSTNLGSRRLFARKDWLGLSPETFFAANFDGRYFFAYVSNAAPVIWGGEADTDFTGLDIYLGGNAVWTPEQTTLWGGDALTLTETNSVGIIDLTGEQPFFIQTALSGGINPTGLHFSDEEGKLYILSNGTDVIEFDPDDTAFEEMRWRSALIEMGYLANFGALLVEADLGPSEEARLTISVYADGVLINQTNVFNTPTRLPGGYLARRWEVEVTGTAPVRSVRIAHSITELMKG